MTIGMGTLKHLGFYFKTHIYILLALGKNVMRKQQYTSNEISQKKLLGVKISKTVLTN
jgi:hypothetical protein